MMKVMLVDDEIAIREGIRNSALWNNQDYTLVGEAPDGEIALQMIRDQNPDILITDIRMPFMDGIQLCKQVKRLMPWISLIILSGYDDFSYARQAISLGVQEYLLKPIDATELREVLDRISARMTEERNARENADKLRRRLTSSNRFIKEKLMASLFIEGESEEEAQRLMEQLHGLGVNLSANCYTVLDIAFTDTSGNGQGMDTLYELSDSSSGTVQVLSSKHGARALVLGDNETDTEERAYSFANSCVYSLDQVKAQDILISIGETVFTLVDIPQSAVSARHIRHTVVHTTNPMRIVGTREATDEPMLLPDLNFRPLAEQLKYVTLQEFDAVFKAYTDSLSSTDIHVSVTRDYISMEALMTASAIVRDAGGAPEKVLNFKDYETYMIPDAETENLSKARELLRAALRYREEHNPMNGNSSIAKARSYLSEHYSNPNLMLQDVAKAVCMSNSRFSTIFSQETGYTFTEYLTALRMNKASELLKATPMRSSQIGYEVGYSDPHYFSYLFKKSTGLTPSEYRKQENEKKQNAGRKSQG